MRFAIPTIADDDLDIANSAEIGAEVKTKISYSPVLLVGELLQGDDVPSSEYSADNTYKPPAGTAGRDLQVICANGVRSDEEIILDFNVVFDGAGAPAGLARAKFNPPAYAQNDTFNFNVGLAVDLIPVSEPARTVNDGATTSASAVVTSATAAFTAGDVGKGISGTGIPANTTILSRQSATQVTMSANATATGTGVAITVATRDNSAKKVRSVTSVAAITGGSNGNRFEIVNIPDDWVEVKCTTDKNPDLPVPKSIAIACGYDGARWVKKGRSDPPTLEIGAKYSSGGDGLMRLNGHKVAAMMEVRKDDRLLTERLVFGGWRPKATPKKGEGDTESTVTATGMYERFAVFV